MNANNFNIKGLTNEESRMKNRNEKQDIIKKGLGKTLR